MPPALAVQVFLAFAFAYFFSALVRAVTATLSPVLSAEFALGAADLGLLAGGYFLGFALTQLPLGNWLDRYGPKRVLLCFLAVAVLGCMAFALARSFTSLLVARVLCGVGVSACLMAPLTAYRRWFSPEIQLRTNSWMLMTGSLGMLASTLPVQWLLPLAKDWAMPFSGWRALFWLLAMGIALAMVLLALRLPRWETAAAPLPASASNRAANSDQGYAAIWANPYFRRMAPLGFFNYGGLLAMQTLWAGPWLTQVAGYSPAQAAQGLFWINLCMLVTFWLWGVLNPRLARQGWHANRLMAWGVPLSLAMIALICIAGKQATTWTWALFCMFSSFVSLSQPAVGMAFAPAQAGRALSAYNLLIFAGVFVVQWGIGLLIDGFVSLGASRVDAFRLAIALFGFCCAAAYARFVLDNGRSGALLPPAETTPASTHP
jgi:predicted MFS family arabinose efflux permease